MGWTTDASGNTVWVADGGAEAGSWKPLADSPGYFYNDATGETKLDQNVLDARNSAQDRDYSQAAALKGQTSFSSSSSSNSSVSSQDPGQFSAELDLKREQMAQGQAQLQQELDLKRQQMAQDWQMLQLKDARDAEMLKFSKDKFASEEAAGLRSESRQTQQLMEQISARRTNNQLQAAGMQQDWAMAQASAQQRAAEFNAQAGMRAQEQNEQSRQFNLGQQRQVAGDIAQFVGNPSDVGKNAAYLLASSSGTGVSKAMVDGKTGYSDESLMPLDLLLGQRAELAKGPTMFNAQTVQAPNMQRPDLSFLNAPGGAAPAGVSSAPTGAPAPSGPVSGVGGMSATPTVYVSGTGLAPMAAGKQGSGFQPAGIDPVTGNLQFTAMAHGGTTSAPIFKGNEKGAELFFNPTGAPLMVIDAEHTKKILDKKSGVPGFADGTLFAGGDGIYRAGNAASDYTPAYDDQANWAGREVASKMEAGIDGYSMPKVDSTAAQQPTAPVMPKLTPEQFLQQTLGKAQGSSPWAGQNLPTPVGLSGPGTSAYIRTYGAALAALRGFNPQLFQEEAAAAQPMVLSGAPTRRTR